MTPREKADSLITWLAEAPITDLVLATRRDLSEVSLSLRSLEDGKLVWHNNLPPELNNQSASDIYDVGFGIAHRLNIDWNENESPSAQGSLFLDNGVTLRFQCVQPPASSRIEIAVRRLAPSARKTLAQYSCGHILEGLRGSVIIAGQTGSGKTTLLQSLVDQDSTRRLVSIEDTRELTLGPLSASLLVTPARTFADALKDALRLAPEVIVLGEVRTEEALKQMLDCLLTHEGLGTIHAGSAEHAHQRLCRAFGSPDLPVETLIEMAKPSEKIGPKRICKCVGQNLKQIWPPD